MIFDIVTAIYNYIFSNTISITIMAGIISNVMMHGTDMIFNKSVELR